MLAVKSDIYQDSRIGIASDFSRVKEHYEWHSLKWSLCVGSIRLRRANLVFSVVAGL